MLFVSLKMLEKMLTFNDGAYFCHCAYVLRISRFLGFQNTMRRKQNLASALGIQKENWGNPDAFFRDKKASIWRKTPYIALHFTVS